MEQMVRDGLFVGGTPPYGYWLCKLGRINKHGLEVHDILVNSSEAAVVKKVFDLYCNGEMGTYRIAQHLSEQGVFNRRGNPWRSSSVLNMLKNTAYIGIRKFGDVKSDILQHLQIIDNKTFALAQKQVENNKLIKPSKTRSEYTSLVLFTDLVYCMHCGKKMAVERKKKTYNNNYNTETVYQRLKYSCLNRSDNPPCDGQKVYSTRIIDEQLSAVISDYLLAGTDANVHKFVSIQSSVANKIKEIGLAVEREKKSLNDLKSEVVEVIRGTSAFGSVLLNEHIMKSECKIVELENEIMSQHDAARKQKLQEDKFYEICKQFDACRGVTLASFALDMQKVVVHQLIDRIYLGRGYKYRIEWKFGGYTQGEREVK